MVKDLLDPQGHGLAGPHFGDLAEPAIWRGDGSERANLGGLGNQTLDSGVGDLCVAHVGVSGADVNPAR